MMLSDSSSMFAGAAVRMVLILVLLDDALRHRESCSANRLRVLILVLLDDALRRRGWLGLVDEAGKS